MIKASEVFEYKGPDHLRVAAVIHNKYANRAVSHGEITGCHRPYDDPRGVIKHWSLSRTTRAIDKAIEKGVVVEVGEDEDLYCFGKHYRSLLEVN